MVQVIISSHDHFINSPNIAENANSRKGYPFNGKKFRPTFSRNIEIDKPRGTSLKSPQGILTIFVLVIRSFLQEITGLEKDCSEKG